METVRFSPDEIAEMVVHFSALASKNPLHVIRNESEYDKAVEAMNALLDAGASNEDHPLTDLVVVLGEFIAAYDNVYYQLSEAVPADVLRELMAQHRLLAADLPEIGSQEVVCEVLAGGRDLTAIQIAALSRRFGVSQDAFLSTIGRSSADE